MPGGGVVSFICTNINPGGRTGLSPFPETLLKEDIVRIKGNNTDKVLRTAPGTKQVLNSDELFGVLR